MTKKIDPFLVKHDGFHSIDDARRMQQMAKAMLAERRHLALTSPDTELLAHYSRLLVRELREDPQVTVLPHLPTSSEYLLDHINGLLAELPIDQVLDRQAVQHRPVQVLVVPDTPQLTTEGLTLLVRLVNDLPGANLRLVLVQGRDLAVTESLRALGPQLLHWNILPPGMTTAQAADSERARQALREAMQEGLRDDSPPGRASPRPSKRAVGTAAATPSAWARSAQPAWAGQNAPALAARAVSRPGRKGAVRASGSPASPLADTQTNVRHNWVLLTGGLLLSAALAAALAAWISAHTPAPRPMAAAGQTAAPQR